MQLQFNGRELAAIYNALEIARVQYLQDARDCRGNERLNHQFDSQARDAAILVDKISAAMDW
jgi:hypothetical protein